MEPIQAPVHWREQLVFEALKTYYVDAQVALLPQVASETGAAARRTADAVAMQLWPSRGLLIECFEFKVSRSDLTKEYKQPEKGDLIGRFCDKFWVATPPGIVKPKDFEDGTFPKMWGCLEVDVSVPGLLGWDERCNHHNVWLRPHTFKVKVVKQAEQNPDVLEPTRKFLAALLRNLQAHESPEATVERRVSAIKHESAREAHELIKKTQEEMAELRRRVQLFEQTTGLSTGVFTGIHPLQGPDEARLKAIHTATSVEAVLNRAKYLARWLSSQGDEVKNLAETLKKLVDASKDAA